MKKRGRIPLDHPELELPEVRKLWQTEELFSEHYLKSRIQSNDWWPSDDAVRPLWQFCVELFNRRYVTCAQNNEAFTRQELINPILAKLGFAWTDNLSLPDQDAEPDYILFADAAEKEKVIAENREKRYRAACALLEAKKVNHPLSQMSKHQQRYPHQQIRDYLQEAQVLGWGILTNGNEWRLYCRDAKPSQFFCVNFAIAIQSLENFKYFVALFSPAAFVRDATGKCRLDAIRESALVAQIELESDLRQRVFTLVEILANGFVERPDNAISDTPEGCRLLYENCLIFLYRLLFILYAEGRQLLPVEPKSRKYYKDLSLARLVSPLKGFTEFDSQTRSRLYEDILDLCHLINGTDEAMNKEYSVPRYNGGLFDPERYPCLERWRICDAKLAEVLRGLMFAKPDRHNRELPLETVDYADLRVQQLGSIYEGLLEHHFAREDGKWTLTNDKAERKATGTYYTPDYIVSYIVEHTLGPLVADIAQHPEVKQGKDNSFADAVLALNICDPAMGSGHFLVEATTWLAEQIVYHPTTLFQAEFRRGESQEQTEIAYWRRRVVEACIYGVDLNPLAVELAKLSLWLTTIAGDQPLNFLDHHLRCGNSLIGARLDDLGKLPERKKKGGSGVSRTTEQITFTFGPDFKKAAASAIRRIQQIEGEASVTVAKVKDKEKLWGEINKSLAPYKSVADLWTSTFFGQPLDEESYVAAAQRILAGETFDNPTASARHFFHWELQFPEVFFAADGTPKPNPGFDAIIGNPPYGRLLNNDETSLAEQVFTSAAGVGDVFAMFIERGTSLTGANRFDGWIVPSGWLTAREHDRLRTFVLASLRPERIIHLPYNVFGAAYIDCIVFVAQKSAPLPEDICLVKRFGGREQVRQIPSAEAAYSPVHLHTWLQDPDKMMVTESGAGQWLRKWQRLSKFMSLGGILRVSRGITPYVEPSDGDSRQKARGFWGSIGRYLLEPEKFATVVYDPSLMEYKPREFFVGKRLIIRRIISRQHRIHAVLVTDDFVINKSSLLALRKDQPCSLEFALTILNSRLISKAFVSMSEIAKRDDFPQLDIATVCELPVPRIAFTTPTAERKRLAKKGQDLYESRMKKNNVTAVVQFAEAQLAADHDDIVHDLLAFLAERIMELNRDKQTVARQFLTDMKDFQGIDAHALMPKTKLDHFWRLATNDLFAHLRANTKRLAEQGIRLKESDEDKLRKRFESAQKKILPLESDIAFTDTLIDQIVYRLYDLTEEEIRIVEGTGN